MHKLVILIDQMVDPAEFENGWPEFLHWAEQMPALQRETTSRVTNKVFGRTEFAVIHELHFDSPQEIYQAMESPAGQAAGRILQNITHGRLTLLIADHREDSLENIRQSQASDQAE